MPHLMAVVILSALIVVPATGVVLVLYPPGSLNFPTRAAAIIAVGYVVPAIIGYLLVVAHILYPVPVAIALVLVTVTSWVLALRRTPLRATLSGLADEFRDETWANLAGLLMITGVAVVYVGLLWKTDVRIAQRYFSDGMQLAATHDIPAFSIEYGRNYPTLVNKVMLNSFNAVTSYAVPNSIMTTSVLSWFAVTMFATSVWALARRLGLKYMAPLLSLALIANFGFLNPELSLDFDAYRAESFIRPITLSALVLAIMAIQTNRRRDAVIAAVTLGAAASGHLVVFLVAAMFLVAYVLARSLAAPRWTVIKPLIKQLAITGGIAAVAVVVIIVVARGDLGFEGASGPASYPLVQGRYDSTIFLMNGDLEVPHPKSEPFYFSPDELIGSYVSSSIGDGIAFSGDDIAHDYQGLDLYLLLGGLLIAAVLQLVLVKSELRYVGLMCWSAMAAMIAASLVFSFRFNLWVLAAFGLRRLFDYSSIPLALWALSLVELPLQRIRRRALAAGISIVLVVGVGARALPSQRIDIPRNPRSSRPAAVRLLSWVRNRTACDSRVVINRRTLGGFEALTGRINISEGMGPFLRPDMMRDLLGILDDIHSLYNAPSESADILDRYGIDYVIGVNGARVGFGAGMPSAHLADLRKSEVLDMVAAHDTYEIYEVARSNGVGDAEAPRSWSPCLRGNLKTSDPFQN